MYGPAPWSGWSRALRHAQTRYQHRDIIRSPLGIRGTDEGATARLFVSLLGQYGFNTRVADVGRQPIRTQQQAISVLKGVGADIGLYGMILSKRLQNDMSVRVGCHFLLAQQARFCK